MQKWIGLRFALAVAVCFWADSLRAAPFPVDCCDEQQRQLDCELYCSQQSQDCDHWECDYDPWDPECLGTVYYYCTT
jgi:hypothetical protein